MAMTPAERTRRYKQNHPDRVAASNEAYKDRNRTRIRQEQAEREQRRRERTRAEAVRVLGECCVECGFSDPRALQIDHVDDDGAEDRKRFGWPDRPNLILFYQAVIREHADGRYQLLCANHNAIKEWELKRSLRGKPIRTRREHLKLEALALDELTLFEKEEQVSKETLPMAVDTDGEDEWWIVGHVDDVTALDAVRRSFNDDFARYFPWVANAASDEVCITRGWWRDAHDPANDERWEKCAEGDEGAQPFTVVEL